MRRILFVSTAFGFGPTSKAVTIARELRVNSPDVSVEFAGLGIALEFATLASVFNRVHPVNVDNASGDRELANLCNDSNAVVSIMNWRVVGLDLRRPVYVVDSLTWMWPQIPFNMDAVARYFVQDYLLGDHKLNVTHASSKLEIVGPIVSHETRSIRRKQSVKRNLLVNFAGAASPLCPDAYFLDYSLGVAHAVVSSWASEFESILFCSNSTVAAKLRQSFPGDTVVAACLPHHQFLEEMSSCSAMMSTPGITTTLEAAQMNVPMVFLPPQNYSQALMAEGYRDRFGADAVIALSDWAPLARGLREVSNEAEGVELTVAAVERLVGNKEILHRAVKGLHLERGHEVSSAIRHELSSRPYGQQAISRTLLRELEIGECS